jgi:hypothetical protein
MLRLSGHGKRQGEESGTPFAKNGATVANGHESGFHKSGCIDAGRPDARLPGSS